MRNWLVFGIVIFVHVISEQINYNVEASRNGLLSPRSCDEGTPGPVQNLQNAVNGTTTTITWDPPEDASCVNDYIISYDDNEVRVSSTTYEINNLLYCTTYQIRVAAVSLDNTTGDYSSTIAETFAPSPFGTVQNFNLVLVERTLNATWNPPESAASCVGKYVIQLWDQNNNNEDHETTETYYEFSPVVGCMTYNVQVKPWVNQSMEGSTTLKTLSVGDLATNPPTNASGSAIDKTWANLIWATDRYTVNMCTLNAITVVCVSSDTPAWIIPTQTVTVNITDSTSRPNIPTNITDLSEFTNYSCSAIINNSGGDSEESEPYVFQTGEEVPSEPLSLAEGEKTSKIFAFSWSEPYKIPGILQDYGIVIERANAVHFIPDDCSVGGESNFAVNVEADINGFVYEEALPSFRYKVNVNASTRVGNGDAAEIYVVTLNDTPERPRDITYSLDIAQSTDYLVNVTITWLLPCNTNGELDHFEITITGTPTFEETEATVITGRVEQNSDIENVSYEYLIEHINASYSYNVSINAVLVDGIEGEAEQLDFISPDGYPGEPILNPIENSESTSFYITWSEPAIKNGELKNYSITIQSHGPLYPVDNERCIDVDTETYTFWQLPNETSYNFIDAKPFYNYTVVIAAATSIGYGSGSNEEFVYTKAAKPDPPSVLSYQHEEYDLTDYNVTGIITWSVPCEINGALSHFHVAIEGVSTYDDRNEKDEIDVDDMGEFTFTIERPLQAAFNYSLLITTVLDDTTLQSDNAEISFLAPDGYPGQPLLDPIEDFGSTYVYFTWSEPVTKNGKLQNYSISVQARGPLYPISEECDVDTSLYSYTLTADSNEFNFTAAKPYYNYTVSLSAATSIGYGAESEVYVVNTLQAEPEPPTSLNSSYEEYDLTNYNVTGTVSWDVPCEVNGALSYFKLIIEGNSTYDDGYEWEELAVVNTEQFSYSIEHALQAAYDYKFSIVNVLSNDLESVDSVIGLLAPDGYPAAPTLNDPSNEAPYSFNITWEQPNTTNGRLVTYSVTVTPQGPLYEVPENCSTENTTPLVFNINASHTTYEFVEAQPYHAYSINVKAATSRGFGVESEEKNITTKRTVSEAVQNLSHTIEYGEGLEYQPNFTVVFERPCHTYGTFNGYRIVLLGVRGGKEPHEITEDINVNTYTSTSIKPDYNYVVSVSVLTEDDYVSLPIYVLFSSEAGVPLGVASVDEFSPPEVEGPHTAAYTFSSDLFDDSNGEILYYAIIVGVYGYHEESTANTWRGSSDTWPSISNTNGTLVYQATPKMWNPFQDSGNTTVTFYIGVGNCTTVYEDCNKELEPETEYAFKVRGFTRHGYRDSPTVTFVTDKLSSAKLALILGIVFGILAALVISGFIFVLWRRKRHWFEKKVSIIETPSAPTSIPVKEFPQYYSNLQLNYNMLKAEYTLLESRTKEIDKAVSVADLPEHKTKNRYCNIKPFDETRVILRSDNNGNYSTYINASYLTGYSGNIEYIATQGPLEATCLDFWRMVLQENVTLIAMVAQCIEQGREKCYQYFPEKHETIEIGDDIEVRCTTELNFGSYIVKNLLVQKDIEKHTLTHLQFVDWPDFGCPTDTTNLLEFCQMMRNTHTREGGKIVVHCSAGVGRSGTLIAVDMLLQGIQANRDIDIFGTVLNLRQQRPKMVQTEKQYAYIHRCVNDVILNPLKPEEPKRPSEAIYENIGFHRENNSNTSSKEKLVKESML